MKVGPQGQSRVGQASKLADSHSMPHGDREPRDRRGSNAVLNIPLYRTSYRIGPIEHHNRKAPSYGTSHDRRDRSRIAVIARSDILEIHQENVHVLQHRGRRWVEPYAIMQQVDRDPGGGVPFLPGIRRDVYVDRAS